MIEHEASGASGSGDRSGVGRIERPRRRQRRTFLLGCVGVVALVGAVFWRPIAIIGCFCLARGSSESDAIARSCDALADLGPSALPALARLADRPEIQRAWSASAAIRRLHREVPEANAKVHDLLLSPSPRVRAVAGAVLVAADEHDASGLPACIEGLAAADADVPVLVALHLVRFPGARFEKEVPAAPAVFVRLVRVLSEARIDPRRVYVDGQAATIAELAQAALVRLDPALERRDAVEAALAREPADVLREARARSGEFFR